MLNDVQREEKRNQILADCLELFVQQGLENTSMNDLTKHCQIYKAAFYYYFKSKDEIVIECAKTYMTALDDMFFKEFLNVKPSLKEALQHGFEMVTKEKNKMRFIYQVISSPLYGKETQEELSAIYTKYLNYSEIFASIYKFDKELLRPYYLLFVGTIHDYCLWGNKELVSEKLSFIYEKLDALQNNTI